MLRGAAPALSREFRKQRVRCPLHSLIEFDAKHFDDTLWRVVQTRPFQRLRRIKQLGFSDLVFPGATHSRFAHSLGAFHTARVLMKVIERHLGSNYQPAKADVALAAALVHDVGHGPFSHAFEEVGTRLELRLAHHEEVSDLLIRQSEIGDVLKEQGSGFANDVADVIKSGGRDNIYSAVVSSQFDADRLDYMRRDRLMTGTQQSAIDLDWIIANLEVGKVNYGIDDVAVGQIETFVLGSKALHAAEQFVLGLFQLYPTVYFHKATRGAEKIFTELLTRVLQIGRGSPGKVGLSEGHPLIRFAKNPEDVESVLCLDDTTIWGALGMLGEAKDKLVAEFANRLKDRNLYKWIDVREKLQSALERYGAPVTVLEKACASIKDKVHDWNGSNAVPRILIDDAFREPYKRFQVSKGPLNQIRISTRRGLADLGEESAVVKAIKPFKLFRLYYSDADQDALKFINSAIDKELSHVEPTAQKAN